MTDESSVEALAAYLGDDANAAPASGFPANGRDVDQAGLYAWWADETGLAQLSNSFDTELSPLIYAGQTGATTKNAGIERLSTLRDRIGRNHLGGNVRSSTFRKTLAASLREPLGLELEAPNKLSGASNAALTEWMHAHLRVATIGVTDRAALAVIEEGVLELLDPPLNLMGMPRTPLRIELSRRRSALGQVAPANGSGGSPAPVRSEAAVVEAFCNHLQDNGWEVGRDVDFVDVKATKEGVTLIGEAKGHTTSPGLDIDTMYGQASPPHGQLREGRPVRLGRPRDAQSEGRASGRVGASPPQHRARNGRRDRHRPLVTADGDQAGRSTDPKRGPLGSAPAAGSSG